MDGEKRTNFIECLAQSRAGLVLLLPYGLRGALRGADNRRTGILDGVHAVLPFHLRSSFSLLLQSLLIPAECISLAFSDFVLDRANGLLGTSGLSLDELGGVGEGETYDREEVLGK